MHNRGMNNDLAPHLAIALRHAPPGLTATPIPRVDICVGQGFTEKAPCLYRSMSCFILQGSKRIAINENLLSYDSEHYLISALDLPLSGQILDAEGGQPYVAVSVVLNPALLAELAATIPAIHESTQKGIGITINPMSAPLRDTLLRLLSLLDTPDDIPVLAPMVERELLYRAGASRTAAAADCTTRRRAEQHPPRRCLYSRQLQRPAAHRCIVRCQWHEPRQPASPFSVDDRP